MDINCESMPMREWEPFKGWTRKQAYHNDPIVPPDLQFPVVVRCGDRPNARPSYWTFEGMEGRANAEAPRTVINEPETLVLCLALCVKYAYFTCTVVESV